MQEKFQYTIKESVSISGIALHTGYRAKATFYPAPENHGYVFCRKDLNGEPKVKAIGCNVIEVERATTIKDGDAVVHTIEHILAALYSMGIDNVLVEMNSPEPPIVDGSAMPFLKLLEKVGKVKQNAKREYFEIKKILHLEMDHALITIVPDTQYRISCTVKYDQSILDSQYKSMEITTQSFHDELSKARTFCSYHELEYLMKAGLIRGGSLDNASVIHGDVIFSKDGLRYPDEFVRHKMLDIVGDFALLGKFFRGHIIAVKPGHSSNVTMVQKMLKLIKS